MGVGGILLATSCTDGDLFGGYKGDKTLSIAEYEYLNDYAPLKEYLSNPKVKLGAAIDANEYLDKSIVYNVTNSNFTEVVTGNAMKMASCVGDDGSMDFSTVTAFVDLAKDNDLNVYGHTLAWHAQQPKKWLNRLIKDRELEVDPNDKQEETLHTYTYAGQSEFPWFVMGFKPDIINGCLHSEGPGDWYQYFIDDQFSAPEDGTYTAIVKMKGSVAHDGLTLTCGWGWGAGESVSGTIAISTEMKEQKVEFSGVPGGKTLNLVLKPGDQGYQGTIDIEEIRFVRYSAPAVEVEHDVYTQTYTDGPFPFYPMGCEPPIVDGAIHFEPTGAWSQFFCLSGNEVPTVSEGKYVAYFNIKSSAAGSVQVTALNGWEPTDESITDNLMLKEGWQTIPVKFNFTQDGRYEFILKPQTAMLTLDLKSIDVKKIESLNSIPLTPEEKRDTLIWAMTQWMDGIMAATGGQVKEWDVINESISDWSPSEFNGVRHAPESGEEAQDFYWTDYFGDEEYGAIVVNIARKAWENAGYAPSDLRLFINDYGLEAGDNKKLKSLIHWIGVWESKGVKFDGIGSQMHIDCYEDAEKLAESKESIKNMLTLMAGTGKLVRISELDMGYVDKNGNSLTTAQIEALPIPQRIAKEKLMADLYQFIIDQYQHIVPANQQYGITQWCLTDSKADSGWRAGLPVGLWTSDWYRKPAYGGWAEGVKAIK